MEKQNKWHHTVKSVLSSHSKIDKTKVLETNGSLMKVFWSILQYFWPALRDNMSWKPILGFFLSGCLRQVLLKLASTWENQVYLYVMNWLGAA